MLCVFLADGFEEIEALATLDILRRAGLEVLAVGVTGKTVTGRSGISVVCDVTEDALSLERLSGVVLPGGLRGVDNLSRSDVVRVCLGKCFSEGLPVAAICAAPTLLYERGYLEGKRYTVNPTFCDRLPNALSDPVVRDGMLITANAAGASVEFALETVKTLLGEGPAREVRNALFPARTTERS